jgi:hypothetical protein
MESRKDHPGLMSWIFRGHQGRKSVRGGRQQERLSKVRVGEPEARPSGHGPGAVVGLLCMCERISDRGDDGKWWDLRQCSQISGGSKCIPECGARVTTEGTCSCLELDAIVRLSIREERLGDEVRAEDDVTVDWVTEDSLL